MDDIINYIQRLFLSPGDMLVVFFELLIIGFVVYWIVNFLEGTRGERLFRGVFLIIVIATLLLNLVVDQFGLERIKYLYGDFAIITLFVVGIAFQPEIRRGLMRIGQASFMSSSQQLSRSVEEIINAVTELAATRTGAIIVIQQQVGLGEFIETGVKIDSKVTAELIKTVFYPGTSLHDMAIVVQGDRIVAARVQLPLAEAGTVGGKALGSRHRAAIGVTVSSDAIVVVVSEETGIISLAMNGQLIRNVAETQLRRHLNTAVVETTPLVEQIQHEAETHHTKKKDTEKKA
ncbi:MAG: TIGR00159 family protein [Planctomycetes bacterium]|nr:TIGR00159 family protein [Planctomycetota bacterium]